VPLSDVDGIGDSALAFCSRKFTNGKLVEPYDQSYARTAAQEEWNKLESAKLDREALQKHQQQELDAPKLKAEYDQAMVDYVRCLLHHTRLLTIRSAEPAETIVDAAFSSCSDARESAFDVYRRHNSTLDLGIMTSEEAVFRQTLLLEVIKARVQSPSPPESMPAALGTPI
jgi:hypothetical protein